MANGLYARDKGLVSRAGHVLGPADLWDAADWRSRRQRGTNGAKMFDALGRRRWAAGRRES